jgi:hypothetical protein
VTATVLRTAVKETRCTIVTSGFRREVGNNCAILGYYAANSGDFLPTFLTLEDGADRLSRNIVEKLPLLVA